MLTTVPITSRVIADPQPQDVGVTTGIDDVSATSPPQTCRGGCGQPARIQHRWRLSWCCDSCEEDGSHDDGCTDKSYDDEVVHVGGFGSRWRSKSGNVTNDASPYVTSDAHGSSSSRVETQKIEYRAPIASPTSIPPALPALPHCSTRVCSCTVSQGVVQKSMRTLWSLFLL